MDKDILAMCDVSTISTKLEESEAMTAKVLSCKQNIEEILHAVWQPPQL